MITPVSYSPLLWPFFRDTTNSNTSSTSNVGGIGDHSATASTMDAMGEAHHPFYMYDNTKDYISSHNPAHFGGGSSVQGGNGQCVYGSKAAVAASTGFNSYAAQHAAAMTSFMDGQCGHHHHHNHVGSGNDGSNALASTYGAAAAFQMMPNNTPAHMGGGSTHAPTNHWHQCALQTSYHHHAQPPPAHQSSMHASEKESERKSKENETPAPQYSWLKSTKSRAAEWKKNWSGTVNSCCICFGDLFSM